MATGSTTIETLRWDTPPSACPYGEQEYNNFHAQEGAKMPNFHRRANQC